METNVRTNMFHRHLVKTLFEKPPSEQQALCLMLLLHACKIVLSEQAEVEAGVGGFEAITSRHAAEVVASLFETGDEANAGFWYHKWNGDWAAYAILEELPAEMISPLRRMRKRIESHPWVERLEDEDWDILELSQ